MKRIVDYPGTFHPVTFGHLDINERSLEYFLKVNNQNVRELEFYGDIIFVHDPQPIGTPQPRLSRSRIQRHGICRLSF